MLKSGSNIFFHPLVAKHDLPRLGASTQLRVQKAINGKLAHRPEVYGLPLRGVLKKFWKLRVGNYRIIYEIDGQRIYILAIAHRKDVYKHLRSRFV